MTDSDLVVSRIGPNVRIGLSQIESVERVADPSVFQGGFRVMGVGGAFGYSGLFYSPTMGNYRAYVVRRDGLVLIHRQQGDPVVLSPREPDELVRQLTAKAVKGDGNDAATTQ